MQLLRETLSAQKPTSGPG